MKPTGHPNINGRNYWNIIYSDENAREVYGKTGTDTVNAHEHGSDTNRFKTALKSITDGDAVLDIGCGVGVFTQLVKKTYPMCSIWGVDISDEAIEANKQANPDIYYSQGYIGRLDFSKNCFDVVFCGETIEHLDDPQVLFNEAFKFLKKGGRLIVTTPRNDRIVSEEHLWFFEQEDVEELFLKAGFKEVKFEYLKDMEHLLIIFAVGTK